MGVVNTNKKVLFLTFLSPIWPPFSSHPPDKISRGSGFCLFPVFKKHISPRAGMPSGERPANGFCQGGGFASFLGGTRRLRWGEPKKLWSPLYKNGLPRIFKHPDLGEKLRKDSLHNFSCVVLILALLLNAFKDQKLNITGCSGRCGVSLHEGVTENENRTSFCSVFGRSQGETSPPSPYILLYRY